MKIHEIIAEGLRDPKDNPCWKGYHPVGTKKKAGRTVPNCVPEAANAAQQAAIAIAKKKKQGVEEGGEIAALISGIRNFSKNANQTPRANPPKKKDEWDVENEKEIRRQAANAKKVDTSAYKKANEGREWDEGNTEPGNNFAVYIDGRKWKVFPGGNWHADSAQERQRLQQLKAWAETKSAATGKKWTVHVTGEPATK